MVYIVASKCGQHEDRQGSFAMLCSEHRTGRIETPGRWISSDMANQSLSIPPKQYHHRHRGALPSSKASMTALDDQYVILEKVAR